MFVQMSSLRDLLCNGVQDTDEVNPEFETLLNYLKYTWGYDLTNYKRPSLTRRFRHRMQKINIDTYQSYLRYLESHSQESLALIDEILINITSFFRDRDTWDYLAVNIIPQIILSKQPDEPIRVWSAGCSTGQEIYSLLILLAEVLGIESCLQRVICYGTDTNESVLAQAQQATYSDLKIANIPHNLLVKYFERTEKGYVFHPKLRRVVTFARHDLTKDPPISNIDLLTCRNVLMYFNLETQISIALRFLFSLKNTGLLVLGEAETLINCIPIFTHVNLEHRIWSPRT